VKQICSFWPPATPAFTSSRGCRSNNGLRLLITALTETNPDRGLEFEGRDISYVQSKLPARSDPLTTDVMKKTRCRCTSQVISPPKFCLRSATRVIVAVEM
jgi:hypothetical protein